MSKQVEDILNKLTTLGKQLDPLFPGKVLSVDEASGPCMVEINDLAFQARLNASENGFQGFMIVPAISSWVITGRLDPEGDIYMVLAVTEVDKIIMRGGENGGLINITDLVTRLNNIEDDINTLKNVFTNWVVAATDGGLALKTAATTWAASSIDETTRADIEDTTILH